MAVREIKPGVYYVGAPHWDRRLFDELIPLPDGTTYNAYLVKGVEKTALIDTVDPIKAHILFDNLEHLRIDTIDYLITNHTEQDHSGSIPQILDKYPQIKIVTNPKCRSFTIEHLLVSSDSFKEIHDGDTLSLGDKTLEFIVAPWVHWPETMLTYLQEDAILFPCDLFGSHLATSALYAVDEQHVYRCAKRYYAEIMMPFRNSIKKHLTRLEPYAIDIIAPSHGPLYNNPSFILEAYQDWISDTVKNEVVLPYVSMHGSVEKMVNFLIDKLEESGIAVLPFNLTVTDIGELAMAIVDAATIVIGSPTVLAGPHPAAVYAAYLTNALRPKTKYVSIIGSFGWGGKMPDVLQNLIGNLNAEVLTPVIAKGHPKESDFKALGKLAETIVEKHRSINLVK